MVHFCSSRGLSYKSGPHLAQFTKLRNGDLRNGEMEKTGEWSQSQGFWDRDFLLGTVLFYELKKVPTKFKQNPDIFHFSQFLWDLRNGDLRNGEMEKNGECSQSQGFGDRDLLLGTVLLYEPKKVPTKFEQNPDMFHFSHSVVHFCGSNLEKFSKWENGECSQSQGFWDRDFLLGTVLFYNDPKKVPTKF